LNSAHQVIGAWIVAAALRVLSNAHPET
jgi:hypothetical protein